MLNIPSKYEGDTSWGKIHYPHQFLLLCYYVTAGMFIRVFWWTNKEFFFTCWYHSTPYPCSYIIGVINNRSLAAVQSRNLTPLTWSMNNVRSLCCPVTSNRTSFEECKPECNWHGPANKTCRRLKKIRKLIYLPSSASHSRSLSQVVLKVTLNSFCNFFPVNKIMNERDQLRKYTTI